MWGFVVNFKKKCTLLLLLYGAFNAGAKVASLDVCADQWLFLTVKSEYIGAISTLSQSPRYSHFSRQLSSFPLYNGNPESLLSLGITHALADGYLHPFKKTILEKMGMTVLVMTPLHSLQDFITRLAEIKKSLPIAYLKNFNLLSSERTPHPHHKTAVIITGTQTVSGTKTTSALILKQLGLKNIAKTPTDQNLDLEELLANPPHEIFISESHPKKKYLKQLFQKCGSHVFFIPDRFMLCPLPTQLPDVSSRACMEKSSQNTQQEM